MPTICLPPDPDLGHLKAQAKLLQRLLRQGEPGAADMVREFHPRSDELLAVSPSRVFTRADAQLCIARLYGFGSWTRLLAHLTAVERFGRSPHRPAQPGTDDPVSAFLRAACIVYGHDDRELGAAAGDVFARHRGLAAASIHVAAAAGDVEAARVLLSEDPTRATAEGGPFRWQPLLYAAYSRFESPEPDHSCLEVARLLLRAGADPDTGYLWAGECLFTALTGAFGGGEDDQPAHPEGAALARLLLIAGADPNDTQTLYNLGMGGSARDTTAHLELLLEFGLGRGVGSVWDARLGDVPAANARLLDEELLTAAVRGLPNRTRFLLDRGVDVDVRAPGHPFYEDRTPYQLAVLHGHPKVAELLASAGAEQGMDPSDAVVAALMAADESALTKLAGADPTLLERVHRARPALVARAAATGHVDAARLLVAHGWNVNHLERTTALHEAALRGDLAMVQALVELGADPEIKDTEFHAPPSGWAAHAGHHQIVDYLPSPTVA